MIIHCGRCSTDGRVVGCEDCRRLRESCAAISAGLARQRLVDANGWDGRQFTRELRGDFLVWTLGRLLADRCRADATPEELVVLGAVGELFREEESPRRCRLCRGDETAVACECV
jgi:hypothetical protein